MRQLTALEEQFLALEGPRHYGHVGGVAVVDPSTAPGGKLEPKARAKGNGKVCGDRRALRPSSRGKRASRASRPASRASRPASRASRPASRAKVATPKGGNSPAGSSAAKRDG